MGDTLNRTLDDAVEILELRIEPYEKGESIFWFLFPACGGSEHKECTPLYPRIGDKTNGRRWLGWQHCSCSCHTWKKTKNGWQVGPTKT